MKKRFKYLLLGNHPVFKYINRRCYSTSEVENIEMALKDIGYETEIKRLEYDTKNKKYREISQNIYTKALK